MGEAAKRDIAAGRALDLELIRRFVVVPFVWISSPDRQEAGASMRVSQVVRIPSQSVDPSVKN